MAHGYLTEASEFSHEPCQPRGKCIACGLQPFDGSYGSVACEAHHGRVLEHRHGMSLDKVAGAHERHVYTVALPRR
jgi:hypothetical protein